MDTADSGQSVSGGVGNGGGSGPNSTYRNKAERILKMIKQKVKQFYYNFEQFSYE